MTLRITESRIPEGFTPYDLGQAVVSSCKKYSLISSLMSPLHVNTHSDEVTETCCEYYVFINEPQKDELCNYSFKWDITLINSNGTSNQILKNEECTGGSFEQISINKTGRLVVSVAVYYNNSCVAELRLVQNVIGFNQTLEDLYSSPNINEKRNIGAFAGNIDTSREIINDLLNYINLATSPSKDNPNDDTKSKAICSENIPAKFLAAIIYVLIFAHPNNSKNFRISAYESAANFIDQDSFDKYLLDYTYLIPLGVCGLTPQFVSTILGIYADLMYDTKNGSIQRCDLFNLLRFPKTNIKLCSAILSSIKKNSKYNEFSPEQFLKNDNKSNEAMKYICEEFFEGLSNSLSKSDESESSNVDGSNDKAKNLATKAVNIFSSPFISILNSQPISGYETYKVMVLDCRSGKPVENAKVEKIIIDSIYTMYTMFDINISEPMPLCLNSISGVENSFKLTSEEYSSQSTTDNKGYLNIKIPKILLLTQEKVTVEVGFHDFPVVLEAQNNDSRSKPIKRSKNELAETDFTISWKDNQGKNWGDSFGWMVRNNDLECESLLKVSEKFDVSIQIEEDGKIIFNDEHTNIYFNVQNEKTEFQGANDSPHSILFAMQWCQPVWDGIDDAEGNKRVNDTSFVTKKDDEDNWIIDLNMHIVSRFGGGEQNPYGHYYGFFDVTKPYHRPSVHEGIDLFSGSDGNIKCFAIHGGWIKNKVNKSTDSKSYGNSIELSILSEGAYPLFKYAHLNLDEKTYTTKKHVICGEKIAQTGRSGNVFPFPQYPSHLHFELLKAQYKKFEPNDITIIGSDLIDSINAKILPSNKLPLILPCKCKYGEPKQEVSSCVFSDTSVLNSCWAVQEFPYDKDTLDNSSNDKKSEYTASNNRDHQSVPFIDKDEIIRFVCPRIFKEGGDKVAQLQAQLKFIYWNKGRQVPDTITIPNSNYFQDISINGAYNSKTKQAIKGLISAYMDLHNSCYYQVNDSEVTQFINLYQKGAKTSNEIVQKAYEWLNKLVPIT